ncbi:phage head closure protein [Clostridium gasigenes]|uniref:phage head closure protein n=1 Tax=Clostridium gasigenes TaxID=94869 RepID=UPI001C0B6B65|nr:phage head closure protein [Clostridium gasigenes]MBU3135063.1 phage head closure protein [Clostridium gasigenes]
MINVNIADLRHRIEVGELKSIENDNGFMAEEFISKGRPYAKVEDVSYKSLYNGATENISNTTKFIIRYKKNFVNDTDLIKFKGVIYRIINVDNVDFKNIWLVIYATIVNRNIN